MPIEVDESLPSQSTQAEIDREFDLYEKHRPDLVKGKFEWEKTFDTLVVTLSTLLVASSFTLLKDTASAASSGLLITACMLAVVCLVVALVDKLLAYRSHKKSLDIFDDEFYAWTPGAWERALKNDKRQRLEKWLEAMKWVCLGLLSCALGCLVAGAFVTRSDRINATPAASTQPTTQAQ